MRGEILALGQPRLLVIIFSLAIFGCSTFYLSQRVQAKNEREPEMIHQGKSNGVCVSPGGRFQPFASEGKKPRNVRELTLCRLFRQRTCCDVSHTHNALLNIRKLASTGEASQDCQDLWEALECSICDPKVGMTPGPPTICPSFCERLFQACSSAYFSMDPQNQVLGPCGVNDFVCGQASEWIKNSTELCRAAGFSVRHSGFGVQETNCYGGKASLDSIANSWKDTTRTGPLRRREEQSGLVADFQQWVMERPFNERVSWAVGGLVLTAGFFFMSRKKSYYQRQKQTAMLRTARTRRLETKMGQGKRS